MIKTKRTTKTTEEKTVEEPAVVELVEESSEKSQKSDKYYEGIGRRKTARARVRIYTKGTGYVVNGKDFKIYFPLQQMQRIIDAPLKKMKSEERFKIEAMVSGGGLHAQAEALRHGISRALVVFNIDFRKRLKRAGYLKRDPRKKERKKYGLKKARKAPRWSKR